MKKTLAVSVAFVCACAWGDLVVPANEPFVYSDAAALSEGHAVLTLEDGASLQVANPQSASAGFVARRAAIAWNRKDEWCFPRDPSAGDLLDSCLNISYDSQITNATAGTYNYSARWYVPQSGDYVFFSAIDDHASVMIDGRPALITSTSCAFAASQSVPLEAGWHTLQILLTNTGGSLGVVKDYSLGLGWAQSSEPFTAATHASANRFADNGDGLSLAQPHNGVFYRRIDVPQGTATIDMTESGLAGAFAIAGEAAGLRTRDGATLVVKGCSNLVFNGRGGSDDVHYPILDADVEFEDNPNGTVDIYGQVSLFKIRPNYVIDDNARIAYWGTNMITGAKWTMSNSGAQLLSDRAADPSTHIEVSNGCKLWLKPSRENPSNPWTWQGIAGVFSNDFTLAGSESSLILRAYRDLELTGAIKGNGTILQYDLCMNGPAVLSGDMSEFSGTLHSEGTGAIRIIGSAAGNGNECLVVGKEGDGHLASIHFITEGTAENPAAVQVNRLVGLSEGGYLEARANQVVTINKVGGTCGLKTANLTNSRIIVKALENDTALVLRGRVDASVESVGTDVTIHVLGWPGETSRVELPSGAGTITKLIIDEGAVVELVGEANVVRAEGGGTLVVSGTANVSSIASTVSVRTIEGGVVRNSIDELDSTVLGDMPALWLDASRADTYQQYLNCVFTNGIVIRRWNDCRAAQSEVFGFNGRGQGYARVYPYVMTNALNGMNVVSMGDLGGQIAREYGHVSESDGLPDPGDTQDPQPETRRMSFNKPIRLRTAVVVFNSARGGGATIIGGSKDNTIRDTLLPDEDPWQNAETAGVLLRKDSWNTDGLKNPATPIFAKYRDTWLDGVPVDPTTTGYNGGWQIVSFNSLTEDGEDVRSLGMAETYSTAGGMDYAEVLIFTNTLSNAERMVVESYLARKWGISELANPAAVAGRGQLDVSTDLAASGAFSGTVNVHSGATLDLSMREAPMTEASLPVNGLVGWFDPDNAADLITGLDYGEDNSKIYALFARGEPHVQGTKYLHGTYNPNNASTSGDRRPSAVRGARGDGPERTWMDFHEEVSDGGGNTLRIKTNPDIIREATHPDFWGNVPVNVRTVFVVSDSCYGGGVPVADNVNIDGLIRRRSVGDYLSHIWVPPTSGIVTNGETRLNGVVVDGTRYGFTGGPEVFSFTTTADFPVAFFGSCGNGATSFKEQSFEVLGEILLYDRVIEGEERAQIEGYLMNKWLGNLSGEWCDWRRATVTGAGTVVSADKAMLPEFANDFAGVLELCAGELNFDVDASGTVTNAISLPGGAVLELPQEGTIKVRFAGKPRSCTLATAGDVAGIDSGEWAVVTEPACNSSCRLKYAEGALRLEVIPSGTSITIR